METEIDSVISLLNPKPRTTAIRSRVIRNLKPPKRPDTNSVCKDDGVGTTLIEEVKEFYREVDTHMGLERPELTWMPRTFTKLPKKTQLTLGHKRFLEFRPYVDPMTSRPTLGPDRGYYYKMQNSGVPLVRCILEDNGFLEAPPGSTTWTFMWHGGSVKPGLYQSLSKYQKINHFPRSHEMTRKDLMYNNLARMATLHGPKNFGFVPKTFIMPGEAGELEYEMSSRTRTWIVKPANSSQGKGIFLTSKFLEVRSRQVPRREMVVSEYIDNPLLIDGLKFDLRIYAAITSVNPLRIYMYKEGLVRFATEKFNKKGSSRLMHLTNYSLNKFSEAFVANTDANQDDVGNKWSLTALNDSLKNM
jgi:tubulin polyglutamylase TTLL5